LDEIHQLLCSKYGIVSSNNGGNDKKAQDSSPPSHQQSKPLTRHPSNSAIGPGAPTSTIPPTNPELDGNLKSPTDVDDDLTALYKQFIVTPTAPPADRP
jgi:hypothetical protein